MQRSADVPKDKLEFLRKVRAEEVDRPDAPPLYRDFVAFLDGACNKPAHYLRYCQTFLALAPFLDLLPGRTILETGGFCDISLFLRSRGFDCRKTHGDLRYEINSADNSIDMVLSLEVIEHIKDRTEEAFEEVVLFRETGVRTYVSEIQRVLKPGGILVLTTPNPCSARALELLVSNRTPVVFRQHVREYSQEELLSFFTDMDILVATTHYSFFLLDRHLQVKWGEIFNKNGWQPQNRGDDHFMVFRKRPLNAKPGEGTKQMPSISGVGQSTNA